MTERFHSLRSQTVGATEQELGVLDGLAAEQHGQTVDAQTEAAVRGAAVLEELQIELDVIGQALLLCLLDRKSTRLNSSHSGQSRMPSSA